MSIHILCGALRGTAALLLGLGAGVHQAHATNAAAPLQAGHEYMMVVNRPNNLHVLDLASGDGRRHLRALLRDADVLAENFAPGTLERLGLPPIDELMRELPRLVVASIQGYARGGPWSSYKSLDFVGQATGGAMSVTTR